MRRSIEQRLNGSKIHFGGLFAKTDYLAKEHSIDRTVMSVLNDLRHRLKNLDNTPDNTLHEEWQEDLEALSLFIHKTFQEKEIPQALKDCFPKQHRNKTRQKIVGECLRMVVEKWDERHIYGTTEETGATTIVIPEKWEYMQKLLHEGCLLNIIRPRGEADQPLTPELIIYQPDYLVDISSIAGCFETYADTPYLALLNRLKTVYPTKAIHLGNLASQFLDEEVHGDGGDYASSVTRFFHDNAMQMAAAEGIDSQFHIEAREQKENIRIAVREALEKEVGHFDATKTLLEPSFFCEMLGLQGRMDLLQKDFRVLIEQKSGKGGFPQKDPNVPIFVEKHYVQMLLYMAMLHYGYKLDGQPIENSHIQSFLLYSKYKKGLVRLGPAPELLHSAIMLRNQIAWCELSYARGEGSVLLRIKPEQLRRKTVSDKFWQQWLRPQLAEVLSPIQNASALEQVYFLRMLRFVAMEHTMSKMGTNTKENSGFASKWHDSLADKMMAGNIITHAFPLNPPMGEDGNYHLEGEEEQKSIQRITLTTKAISTPPHGEGREGALNFRHGDIVVLYAYEGNHEPDIRQTIVHRGTIEDITTEHGKTKITILLRSPQTDSSIFKQRKNRYWAIEHDFYESSSTALYRSLHQFLTAPAHRKSLILTKREPERNTSLTLKGDYGNFSPLVEGALQAKDMFLVIGPPGTGKTSFGLMNILKEHLMQGSKAILLMSYTNRAVDEICSKLCEPDDGSAPYDFLRVGSALSCEPKYREFLLNERSRKCKNIGEIHDLIDRTQIFVGTTTALTSASIALFRLKSFDLAIIDEASQILEPQLLGLLSATNGIDVAIKKFVLIGDHKQLPAVVQQSLEDSKVTEPELNEIGLTDCRNSLFERLLHRLPQHSYMLRNQGRMHPDIAEFPNLAFYDGKLGVVPLPHQEEPSTDNRISFICASKPEHSASDKENENEAIIVAKLVFEAYKKAGKDFDALRTVGVIVPYRNQITAVRRAIDSYGIPDLHDITIDTVERYQGSQRELIIYSFTVQHRYQLNFLAANTFIDVSTGAMIDRKLNVALTRARRHEVIIGNPDVLQHNAVFKNLIEYCKQHGCFTEIQTNDTNE